MNKSGAIIFSAIVFAVLGLIAGSVALSALPAVDAAASDSHEAGRFIMAAVAHVTDESGLATEESIRQRLERHKIVLTGLELRDAPHRLVEWEMLRREGADGYRLAVELVRRWSKPSW